jgi:hypothetical protein
MNQIVSEKKFIQERLGINFNSLSQSYLRAETQLTTLSSYKFLLQRSQNPNALVTERLLDLNDQFVITHLGMFLKYIAADSPTTDQQIAARLLTYVDANTITVAAGLQAQALYNGNLNFTIDRKEFLPNFAARSFERVPETQTAANAFFTASGQKLVNASPNGLYGFYPFEPVLIDGRQTLDISVNLNAGTTIDGASMTIYAVLECRGYLVVNAKS